MLAFLLRTLIQLRVQEKPYIGAMQSARVLDGAMRTKHRELLQDR